MHHLLARQVRVGFSRTGVQQTQKVIHFGHGTYRRARVLARCLLVDRDDRTQPRYLIYVRTLHLTDEAARIGRERIHITALTLGEDGVEGQRGFSRTAQARDHRQPLARDRYADVLQVMHPRSQHLYMSFVLYHSSIFNLQSSFSIRVQRYNKYLKYTRV